MILQQFTATIPRGFRGNVAYRFQLPDKLQRLGLKLQYNKEHIPDPSRYLQRFQTELRPQLSTYLGHTANEAELLQAISSMKTEIQLCLMVQDRFVGNVHVPGTTKELWVSADAASHGCLPCSTLKGMAEVIVYVLGVMETDVSWQLNVIGETGETL